MEINNPNNISSSSRTTERKIIERNRRNQMKALYSKLNSLIPQHYNSRESTTTSLPDQLGEAANYIKSLQTKLERMKEKRDSLIGEVLESSMNESESTKSPQIQIQEMGSSSLVIGLTTESKSRSIFNDIIGILCEEGAEIVNASVSVVDGTAFHTVHLTVNDGSAAVTRISERLNEFVHDTNA